MTTCGSAAWNDRDHILCNPEHSGSTHKASSVKKRCLVGRQSLIFLGAGHESFSNGRNGGMLKRHDGPLESDL